MPAEIHITSAVVHVRPEAVARVCAHLAGLAGVETHAVAANGKVVITLETEDEHAAMALLDSIRAVPGTIDAAMVYHGIDIVEPNSEERMS